VVVGGRPNPRCEGCFLSDRDNPLLQGTIQLQITGDSGHTFPEAAERLPQGLIYTFVRLDASLGGNGAVGATPLDLIPVPRLMGKWETGDDQRTTTLPWEIHGTELGYGLSHVSVGRRSAQNASSSAPQSPIQVELSPNVMLVPIQVVRVIPESPSAPFAASLAKFTKAAQKRFWDLRWSFDTFRVSEPGIPNKASEHTLDRTELPFDVPDDVWAQCGIQFRMITCPGSTEGCPDLRVSDPGRVATTSCTLGHSLETSANWSDAERLPGVRADLPIVTFNWRVAEDGCVTAAIAKRGRAAIGFGVANSTSSLVVAHELGHVLGLDDFSNCRGEGRHLMCNEPGADAPLIRREDCATARRVAADFVKRQWNVDVAP
jgi:hypothetical protein